MIAAGKAAGPMAGVAARAVGSSLRRGMVAATHRPDDLAAACRFFEAGHPIPNDESVAAGRRALEIAATSGEDDCIIVLLSGGASALLAAPIEGVSLADKQSATRLLLEAGADITSLNAVRKHLSAIKGGRLAAVAPGATIAFAISDVVGDDPSVIGSGPTAPDPTTFQDALDAIDRLGVRDRFPRPAREALERGARGELEETPKPGAGALARSTLSVVGGLRDALEGARQAAEARGYSTAILESPITGEARTAGRDHAAFIAPLLADLGRPACVLSGGETTVRVTGRGKGGRNQEFVLGAAASLPRLGRHAVVGSVGTDGIDGPTDAAGAIADTTTLTRAVRAGLDPSEHLASNDAYSFFSSLGDLIITGPTDTNVGDMEVLLVAD